MTVMPLTSIKEGVHRPFSLFPFYYSIDLNRRSEKALVVQLMVMVIMVVQHFVAITVLSSGVVLMHRNMHLYCQHSDE